MIRRIVWVAGLTLAHAIVAYFAMTVAALGGAVRAFTHADPTAMERVADPLARVLLLPLVLPLMQRVGEDFPEWAAIAVFLLNSAVWGVLGSVVFAALPGRRRGS